MVDNTTTTKHKIGKITYLVKSSPSDKATDTLEQKIEKMIVKDLRQNCLNPQSNATFS